MSAIGSGALAVGRSKKEAKVSFSLILPPVDCLFPPSAVHFDREVMDMDREQMGKFISACRRELGLTQQELAERLHVTNKAVSKWERGLSYPDVTLLEPLASALGLRIEGLMACRRQAAGGGEVDPVKNLLTISSSSLRRERRRSWGVVAGVLAFMLIVTLLVGYNLLYMTETRQDSIVLKETVDGENYLYMEEKGHLLRLRCGKDVDFDAIALDDGYCPLVYEVELRWNRLTYTGTAISCTTTGTIRLGSPMDTDPYWQEATLFGSAVLYATDDYYPDPYAEPAGRRFLCDFYVKEMGLPSASRTILLVEDCISGTVADVDDDGENEAVVRTRWPEKPYTVYDYVDGEIVETWPDTLPEAVLESLVQF